MHEKPLCLHACEVMGRLNDAIVVYKYIAILNGSECMKPRNLILLLEGHHQWGAIAILTAGGTCG